MKANTERKYYVSNEWIFNLESMSVLLRNLERDFILGDLENGEILGYDYYDIDKLIDECNTLELNAKMGKVTSKEYGRIFEIVNYRVEIRYSKCIENGMSDNEASVCFRGL